MRLPTLMFVLMFVLMTTDAWADTLELISGERLDGRVKDVTATSVGIEVAGKQIRVERAKVRAIYLGAPMPQVPSTPSDVAEALSALKALQSVVSAGVTYRDYVARVADTKIRVDRAVNGTAPPEIKALLSAPMAYYILAAKTWEPSGSGDHVGFMAHLEMLESTLTRFPCAVPAQLETKEAMVRTMWACASVKIAEAEKQSLGK